MRDDINQLSQEALTRLYDLRLGVGFLRLFGGVEGRTKEDNQALIFMYGMAHGVG